MCNVNSGSYINDSNVHQFGRVQGIDFPLNDLDTTFVQTNPQMVHFNDQLRGQWILTKVNPINLCYILHS